MSLFDLPGYLDLAVVSADVWGGRLRPLQDTKRSAFKAKPSATYQLLHAELKHLGAEERTLYVAVSEADFRRDGRPRAGARILAPGVVLEFTSNGRRFEYVADKFLTQHENIRAIALTLEHLRAVDRYGLTDERQQYAGFLALEGATPMPAGFISYEEARRYLLDVAPGSYDTDATLLRFAKRKAHPDTGGDADTFQRVALAEQYLKQNGYI